uniref:Uncharacterized protein n=1 Tax=Kalanchoe fedtschenkoi TaxID=63787 RepID=A0A7N0UD55_KALFE
MEVQIVTEAWVRPSTPTPPHLQTFRISLLDQLIPNCEHVPAVFYYDHDEAGHPSVAQKLQLLKTSLSEILPRFYPLAGRIKTDLVIDCNDEGVRYREARVNCDLKQFMGGSYDLSQIMHFHPLKHNCAREGTHVANVQVTEFQCGGLAIGVCICHVIADGVGFSVFMKAWAAAARGCVTVIQPNFNSVSVFPAHDTGLWEMSDPTFAGGARNGNFVTRKFTFDSASITELRELATGAGLSRRATRVEAISALLWKWFMIASRERKKQTDSHVKRGNYLSAVTHSVNLRARVDPSFTPEITQHTMGNLIWFATAVSTPATDMEEPDMSSLCAKIREAISEVDDKFIQELKGEDKSRVKTVVRESLRSIRDVISEPESDLMVITSWCKFGLYEADFGWGKPRWIGYCIYEMPTHMSGAAALMDTRDGEGIEAWVTMDVGVLDMMSANSEFTKFARPTQTEFGQYE